MLDKPLKDLVSNPPNLYAAAVSFSLQWLLFLGSVGFRHAGFSSWGTQALERRLNESVDTNISQRLYIQGKALPSTKYDPAAAKSLQSCLTLCDPIDGSPPGSPIPGILQARTLEWVAISFSNAWKW